MKTRTNLGAGGLRTNFRRTLAMIAVTGSLLAASAHSSRAAVTVSFDDQPPRLADGTHYIGIW